MCPDVAGVFVQLLHGRIHIHIVLITEETVGPWPLCHIFHVPRGQQFHAFPGSDVLQVASRPAAGTAAFKGCVSKLVVLPAFIRIT